MQHSRQRSTTRKVSKWNAYLSQEITRHNNELPAGDDRKRVSDTLVRDIASQWQKMTPEERELATGDKVKELYEQRANRAYGRHNVPICSFGDACRNLAFLRGEFEALHNRTKLEFLVLVARGDQESYLQPFTYVSSTSVEDFVVFTTKATVEELGIQMEGFLIGRGSNVAAQGAKAQIMRLKRETATLIDKCLQEASRRGPIPHMKYVNFDDLTNAYGIVVEGWPLNKFKAPGNFSSRTELEILLGAWKSGQARFRCLADDEWDVW
ncbi:hypothetical protein C8Q78DRAFT_965938, partial [Trametes maxima]